MFLVAIYLEVEDEADPFYQNLGWIPLLALMFRTLCHSNIVAVCYIITNEVFPIDIR